MTGEEQKGLTSILQTGPNYQSKQQKEQIMSQSGRRRGGRGDMNQSTNKHARSTTIRISEPPPPPSEQKDQIHHFILRFNSKVMGKKQISVPKIIEDTCKSIYEKTRNKATFFATAKIQLPSSPIEDIFIDFPSSKAELQDFFHVHDANDRNAEIHLSFTMLGTTEAALHDSMRKMLWKNFLWLTSDKLSAKQKDEVCIEWQSYLHSSTRVSRYDQCSNHQISINKSRSSSIS